MVAGDEASIVELAFHRVEGGLDPLAYSAEFPQLRFFVFPIKSNQFGFEFSRDEVLEFFPGEACVAVQWRDERRRCPGQLGAR